MKGSARRFRALLDDPRAVQEAVLLDVLSCNARCEYGRRYDFASITSSSDFRRRLPVVSAEEWQQGVQRMVNGEPEVLLCGHLVAFEPTGGSSGGAKLVPYTDASLEAFRCALVPWLDDLFCSDARLAAGTMYWSVSPACRERRLSPAGIPIGLDSEADYLGGEVAAALAGRFSVPQVLGWVRDINTWRHLTVHYLLADENLALISIWSPTFLLELMRYARENASALAASLTTGELAIEVPAEVRAHLPSCKPNPQRALDIFNALAEPSPRYEALWPQLRLISCWDQAASRVYAQELRYAFPGVEVQGKGLLATEGVVSIPLTGVPLPVLALESGFYEFIDARGTTRLADELSEGEEYELLITNHSGLYRYAIGDRIRVGGFVGQTPMIEFIGRTGVVSDLCGEKITEAFALRVLEPLGLRFAALAPHGNTPRGYVLLLDAEEVPADRAQEWAANIDSALGANPQYAYARNLQQLAALRSVRCVHPLQSWIDSRVARGQQLGDIKPGALCCHDWQRIFVPVQ
jgi:hypothetical protein